MHTLVLFDIDATLLLTGGLGVRCMQEAGRICFGPSFSVEGTDFAGRLDPLLLDELMTRNGVTPSPAHRAKFREVYGACMRERCVPGGTTRALPGTRQLVDTLTTPEHADAVAIGVLTGNFEETGRLKLAAAGFDTERFHVRVWGDDSPHDPPDRTHLGPVALERHRTRFGREPASGGLIVIGDTPHDVRCAKAAGGRCLGVGTGKFTRTQLLEAGADHAVDDLSDTPHVLSWLTQRG